MLRDASVAITGGTGSFGRAFARHALEAGARRVVIFSRGEAAQAAMREEFKDGRLRFFVGDVRDAERLLPALRGVEVLVHAAALKRVDACENDPTEAVKTNILGTINVASACIARGVARAVFLSTDKASAPATMYGSTKHAAERIWTGANVYAAGTPTRFAATRYGNVIASTGSVIPLWRAQHAAHQPITVTEMGATRFWMPMTAAVALVERALADMRGGEVFVPKIGAASLHRLAEAVAPGALMRIEGLRAGEKMHETLISEDEARLTHDAGDYFLIEPPTRSWTDEPERSLHPPVPPDFTYRSDRVHQLSLSELREMIST